MPPRPRSQDVNVDLPTRGLSDYDGYHTQKAMTTREAVNVRGIDSSTGRERIAQRSGLSRFNETALSNPIQDINCVVFDSRRITYTAVTSAGNIVEEWSNALPSMDEGQRVETDVYGNVYCLSGIAAFAVLNPDGVVLDHVDVPTTSADQRINTIRVDDQQRVYVAVSNGPQGSQSKVWQYAKNEEGNYEIRWEVVTRGYVPDLDVRDGLMYVLDNRASKALANGFPSSTSGSAHLTVYGLIDSTVPEERWTRAVPFPASQIRVNSAGAAFVASLANSNRGQLDELPCSTESVGWIPTDVTSTNGELWSWHDARDLTNLADGDDVGFWLDKSGNSRNLFHWTDLSAIPEGNNPFEDLGILPPAYATNGLCDQPTVRFNGKNGLGTEDTRETNADDSYEQNLSLWPSTNDQGFVFAMVVCFRGGDEELPGTIVEHLGEAKYRIIGNQFLSAGPTQRDHGQVRLSVTPAASAPESGDYETSDDAAKRDNCAIILFHMKGDDTLGSAFHVNGEAVTWSTPTINRDQVRGAMFLGFAANTTYNDSTGLDIPGNFRGDIAEIVSFRETGATGIDSTFIETIEGYMAHKWGLQHLLPGGHAHKASAPGGSGSPTPAANFNDELKSTAGVVAKLAPNTGDVRWAFAGAGVGDGVTIDDNGNVWNVGRTVASPSDTTTLRKFTDDGDGYTEDWTLTSSTYPENGYFVTMAADEEQNLYAPSHPPSVASSLYKITSAGAVEWEYDTSPLRVAYAVATPPTRPDYNNDAIKEPEFLYIMHWNLNDPSEETITKIRIVTQTIADGDAREKAVVVVNGGNVQVVDPDQAGPGDVTTPTGGTGALNSSTAKWVRSAVLFGEVFYTDGTKYAVYNPVADTVETYQPSSPGQLLERCKLIESWGGRLVVARPDADAHNWMMTALGDPYDVDLAPPVPLVTQAVLGNDSRAGVCPDIVNALVPYDDDLLLFGGDHSIHRMTGDPAEGGRFDLMTDVTGMAFGRPWAKDERGTLYFFGARGGVWAMRPNTMPERISDQEGAGLSIENRLEEVDLTRYTIRMAWNDRDRCLHVFLCDTQTPSATVKHYAWERKGNRWWEDDFGSTDNEPVAVVVIDGDKPSDRKLLIAGQDNRIREWDPDATDDDQQAIDSRVLIGPLRQPLRNRQIRISRLDIELAQELDGGDWELLGTQTPQLVNASTTVTGTLLAGRNGPIHARTKGQAAYIRIRNAASGERWALESIVATVSDAGRL